MNLVMKSALAMAVLSAVVSPLPVRAADNPMEYVGIEHNRYLDCLLATHPDQDGSLFLPLVEQCGYRGDARALEERYGALIGALRDGVPADELLAAHRALFSRTEYEFLLRIQWILQDGGGEKLVQTRLSQLEREALQAVDPTSTGGQAVLSGIAVARYSSEYWSAHAGAVPTARGKWWQIIAGDCVGAVLGSVLGGAGAVPLSAAFSTAVALAED